MLDPKTLLTRFNRGLWDVDPSAMPRWRAVAVRALRLVYAVVRDLTQGNLNLQAMSLVYTTLLSLVPLLAVSFSVLKGFGVHNQVEPLLLNILEPLGEKGVEITRTVIGFVENVKVGVLGSLGLGLLIYTVISLIQKVERAFNFTWRVRRLRPLAQRFSDYLSVLLIGPVLLFSALGTTASIMSTSMVQDLVNIPPFGLLVESGAKLVPYVFVISGFTFAYVFVPNTRVKFLSALTGAVVAGVLWQSIGWGFASFIVTSTKYTAIYSGFAIVVMFMIWLYLAWLILLVGASIAFYHQHPEYLTTRTRELHLSNRLRERLALLAMVLITRNHFRERRPWSAENLAAHLGVPTEAMEAVVEALVETGLLARAAGEPVPYLPARAPETVAVAELLEAVRASGEDPYLNLRQVTHEGAVDRMVAEVRGAVEQALEGRNLRDLALDTAPGTVETAPPSEQTEDRSAG